MCNGKLHYMDVFEERKALPCRVWYLGMRTTGFRSIVLYIILGGFLVGMGYLCVNLFLNGSRWAMQPYNGHVYAEDSMLTLGEIKDRNGNLLASSVGGTRIYSEDETVRRALLHTVGDSSGYIGTSVQSTMRTKLSGYNIITGLSNTVFNRFGSDIRLTVDQNVCAAAYNALGDYNGSVIVYNYKTGEIVCKVSKPGYDPAAVPEDLETNEAYKGVFLDNTLSSSLTPGSIFKFVTAAAVMEKWPDSWQDKTYTCEESAEIGGDTVTCLAYHGDQDLYAAMGNSCNLYFAHISQEIGAEALQKKAEQMGFNKQLQFGNIAVEKSIFDVTKANANQLAWASVGQYTALANPYHMMVLMGSIANGGTYVQPRLTGDTGLFDSLGSENRTFMDQTEADRLKAVLRSDVENYYGDYLFPSGMNVCAKTGTGEVGEGKAPNCWMIGFCDSSTQPYAFAVVAEQGVGGIETAGNIAAQVLSSLA